MTAQVVSERHLYPTNDGLFATKLTFRLQLQSLHFGGPVPSPSNSLVLRCTAQIGNFYQEYTEIELGVPQRDPIPARECLDYSAQAFGQVEPKCESLHGTGGVITIQEFPYIAILGYQKNDYESIGWFCHGTLVSTRYILSTGHCVKYSNDLIECGRFQKIKANDTTTYNGRATDRHTFKEYSSHAFEIVVRRRSQTSRKSQNQ